MSVWLAAFRGGGEGYSADRDLTRYLGYYEEKYAYYKTITLL